MAPAPSRPAAAPPAPAPAPQVAALPPASQPVEGRVGRLDFGAGVADLPTNARDALDKAAAEMKQDESVRLQIVAYATGGDEAGSQARRLSLSRALAVRSYLIEQGVRSTRMDVRALGNRSPDGPADRVDMIIVRR
jgi:outer membrane protein OmpA-like peptidoglycan-associated protein